MEHEVLDAGLLDVNDETGTASGQALVEYSLILVLVVVACLTVLFVFQDAVINGIWHTAAGIGDVLTNGM
jgi:Flp pilus assembly pilin Flp